MHVYIYKTQFSNGAANYHAAIAATSEGAAYDKFIDELHGVDNGPGYGCDDSPTAELVAVLASDAATLIEDLQAALES